MSEAGDFSPFYSIQAGSWGHPGSYVIGTCVFPRGLKWPEYEAYSSLLHTVVLMLITHKFISAVRICIRVVHSSKTVLSFNKFLELCIFPYIYIYTIDHKKKYHIKLQTQIHKLPIKVLGNIF
jgi:uncharacterized membrane protein